MVEYLLLVDNEDGNEDGGNVVDGDDDDDDDEDGDGDDDEEDEDDDGEEDEVGLEYLQKSGLEVSAT